MRNHIKNSISGFSQDQRGVAAVEFALMIPFLILMHFGLMDLMNFVTTNRHVTASAGVVGDLVAANDTNITSAQVADYYNAAYLYMQPVPNNLVRVDVFDFRKSATGIVSQAWTRNNGVSLNCGSTPTPSSLTSYMDSGTDLVVSRVCTPYKPFFGTFLNDVLLGDNDIILKKSIYQKPRLNPTLSIS